MSSVTNRQIGMIHALKAKAGMDDDAYRFFLEANFSASSSRQLTVRQAAAAIDRLKVMAGQAAPAAAGAVAGLDTPVGGKLRALWIAGYDLGVVRDRTDRAMLSFLERQCGVSHTRFLQHPSDATSAIEALKSWLHRDGGVAWPESTADIAENKRAVIAAQWGRLVDIGEVKPFAGVRLGELPQYAFRVAGRNTWPVLSNEQYGRVQQALGRKLRGALARRDSSKGES